MKFAKYFHTIRFLKPEQIFFQIYYKLCAKVRSVLKLEDVYNGYKKGVPVTLAALPCKQETYCGDNVFAFLNISHKFGGVWDERGNGDLWRYNLNYMDFLLQPSMTVETGCAWMGNFMDSAKNNSIANDPYPISLRGINWIKFVSLNKREISEEFLKDVDAFLYSQYKILCGKTERHLLANHYLENAFSLLFAAVYFRDAMLWKRALGIIKKQLPEQILADGAHFELSPMYHCIILERLLDCYNLLCNNAIEEFPDAGSLRALLLEKARAMLAWLDAMVVADGRIPLLNDSAENVALAPEILRGYAKRLNIEWCEGCPGESGYRRIKRDKYEAVIDMAPLGVSYNLGHSHADTGTFLLWCGKNPLLVDAGTSTYNAGARRDYERSTMAHNTVVVNGENSSKVWGAFRCAQRASVVVLNDGPEFYEFAHDGYSRSGVCCKRGFVCGEDSITIADVVDGGNIAESVAYFHLSPQIKILAVEKERVVTDLAVFAFSGHRSLNIADVFVAREYNSMQPAKCICVAFGSSLTTVISDFV